MDDNDARICELHHIVGEVDRVTALLADVTAMVDLHLAPGTRVAGPVEGWTYRLVAAHAGIRTMQRQMEDDLPALVARIADAHGPGPRD